jgi:DNA-binding transcriptional ArsR family regulator
VYEHVKMEKKIVVAPVGDNMDALYIGIKEFPTERVILLTPENKIEDAKQAQQELKKFGIPVQITEIKGNIWEDMFQKIAEIKSLEKGKDVIINTATGDRMSTCAATSAAFVNGLKAMAIDSGMAMMLPVLKFSYYSILTDKKMEILKLLKQPGCCRSLEELGKKTKMSLPLISYHINGNLKSEGLKSLGLVETMEDKGRIAVKLSTMGKLLVKGYVSS